MEIEIMKRTQIYLNDDIYSYVKTESQKMNKSMSELIRDIIISNIKNVNDNLKESSANVFGLWKNRDFNTNDYVRELRKSKRLDVL
jgi:hypothetical protein